jgi:hypothetical protein
MNESKPSKFCQSCGTQLVANAAFCPSCGTAVGAAPVATPAAAPINFQSQVYASSTKSKTTAVVLAVFLSFWTWLYTFKVNKTKFFIGLGVGFVAWIMQIASLLLTADDIDYYAACIDDEVYYGADPVQALAECTSYAPDYTLAFLAGFMTFGIWLWAVIDNARKPVSFYEGYPSVR